MWRQKKKREKVITPTQISLEDCTMKNYYDIAIIGGGIGGLMTAYRITEKNPSASVCIIEKGHGHRTGAPALLLPKK